MAGHARGGSQAKSATLLTSLLHCMSRLVARSVAAAMSAMAAALGVERKQAKVA